VAGRGLHGEAGGFEPADELADVLPHCSRLRQRDLGEGTHSDEGIRAAKEIRATFPEVAVLVLSQYVELRYAMELLSDSVERVCCLLKDRVSDVNEFRASVRRVAEGGSAIDPAVVTQLVGMHRDVDPLAELTPGEREVLELMAEGRSNHGIATKLVVTEHAVEKHIRNIFQKLRIDTGPDDHRRLLAVLTFLRSTGTA
jgi:DNA-binding NarL/FixJ family response regulator